MAYTETFDETTPPDASKIRLGDDRIRELKRQIKERWERFFSGTINTDPPVPKNQTVPLNALINTDVVEITHAGVLTVLNNDHAPFGNAPAALFDVEDGSQIALGFPNLGGVSADFWLLTWIAYAAGGEIMIVVANPTASSISLPADFTILARVFNNL